MNERTTLMEQPASVAALTRAPAAEPSDASSDHWFGNAEDFDVPVRGDIREGTVVSADVGEIRIDVGGKSEGVIDSRELDRMPRQVCSQFTVGEQLQVYVVNPEDRDGNVVLSLEKAEQELDWLWAQELLDTQEVIEGEIAGFNKGGLLVQMRHLRGFLPGSQIDRGLAALKLDERLGAQVGVEEEGKVSLAQTLGDAVYWLVFLLFLPAILGALQLEGLLHPVQGLVDQVLASLPNLFAVGLILVIGWFAARVVQRIVGNLLAAVGIDRLSEQVGVVALLGQQRRD